MFHKKNETVSTKESLAWTTIWIIVAFVFGGVIYWIYDANMWNMNPLGKDPTQTVLDYYTGYIVEESLSLDNIFVIAMIFQFFKIEAKFQHRILFWGIIGAVVLRCTFIFIGSALLAKFGWIMYVFGAFLAYTGIKMFFENDEKFDLANMLRATFELTGCEVGFSGDYPGWTPNANSEILDVLTSIYEKQNGTKPHVVACHAGLECGILGTNYPEMDMISFGPTIKGAHSPDERANIASAQKYWKFVLEILENIPVRK